MLEEIKERLLNVKTISGVNKLIIGGIIVLATVFGITQFLAQVLPIAGMVLLGWGVIDIIRK